MPAQSLVWIIAGAVVLVCAAVVTTVFLVRPAAPTLTLAKAAPAPPAANTSVMPAAAPVPVPTPAPAPVTPAAQAIAKTPEAVPARNELPASTGGEAAVPPPKTLSPSPTNPRPAPPLARVSPSAPTSAATGAAVPDPRIQSYVDMIKVAGIRSSGTDSKVLMNDRVYRVNDIVDRSLNLRLIEVQSDRLGFIDENGVTYSKNF